MIERPSKDAAPNAARKERAARLSVFASAALAMLKFAAAILSGSLALLSDALHALIDCGATLATWFAVRAADKPADDSHHYGHGKIEALVALVETGFLFALALLTAGAALARLGEAPAPLHALPFALGVLAISAAVDVTRWLSLKKIADETGSDALAADALHFSSDLAGSLLVAAGMIAAWAGVRHGDTFAALAIAAFISIAGWRLARRTIDTLVDAAPPGAAESVRQIAQGIRGVATVDRVRVRPIGRHLFAEILIGVARTLPLERIQEIKDKVAAGVAREFPGAEIAVTAEPRTLDDETVLERVLLIAAKRRTPIHHVTVQQVQGVTSISLDIELDGRMTLLAAHAIASKLEEAIKDEFGAASEVETHIEPLQAQGITGVNAAPAATAAVAASIRDLAISLPGLGRVHDVRLRGTALGQVVSLHVEAPAQATVESVHDAVDKLEQAIKAAYPKVIRIVTHAEPPLAG